MGNPDPTVARCERCRAPHQTHDNKWACPAHQKQARGGGPCGARAGWGTNHVGYGLCKAHGGDTPGGVRQAQQLQAAAAVATYGIPVDTTPEQALLDEVHRTAGHVAWLRDRIAELDPDTLIWGKTKTEDVHASEFTGVNTTEAAAVNIWLNLYQTERKHLVEVCRVAIAAGIAERQVRITEALGEMMGSALGAILDGLGLTDEQREKVPGLVERHLRAVN